MLRLFSTIALTVLRFLPQLWSPCSLARFFCYDVYFLLYSRLARLLTALAIIVSRILDAGFGLCLLACQNTGLLIQWS
ncbi:hypothetical protein BDF19DRAFT_435272 [Syncephalis fuscata]|nr:hypothetical protein BDF19DRAFT_435272 [Syncephalis fuscata]